MGKAGWRNCCQKKKGNKSYWYTRIFCLSRQVTSQDEYDKAATDLDKNGKLGDLNDLVHENAVLSNSISSAIENAVFALVRDMKSLEFPEGNCKIAWKQFMNKYAPHTALSQLKFNNEFHNSMLTQLQ